MEKDINTLFKIIVLAILMTTLVILFKAYNTLNKIDNTVDIVAIHINELTNLATTYVVDEYSDDAKELASKITDSISARVIRRLKLE